MPPPLPRNKLNNKSSSTGRMNTGSGTKKYKKWNARVKQISKYAMKKAPTTKMHNHGNTTRKQSPRPNQKRVFQPATIDLTLNDESDSESDEEEEDEVIDVSPPPRRPPPLRPLPPRPHTETYTTHAPSHQPQLARRHPARLRPSQQQHEQHQQKNYQHQRMEWQRTVCEDNSKGKPHKDPNVKRSSASTSGSCTRDRKQVTATATATAAPTVATTTATVVTGDANQPIELDDDDDDDDDNSQEDDKVMIQKNSDIGFFQEDDDPLIESFQVGTAARAAAATQVTHPRKLIQAEKKRRQERKAYLQAIQQEQERAAEAQRKVIQEAEAARLAALEAARLAAVEAARRNFIIIEDSSDEEDNDYMNDNEDQQQQEQQQQEQQQQADDKDSSKSPYATSGNTSNDTADREGKQKHQQGYDDIESRMPTEPNGFQKRRYRPRRPVPNRSKKHPPPLGSRSRSSSCTSTTATTATNATASTGTRSNAGSTAGTTKRLKQQQQQPQQQNPHPQQKDPQPNMYYRFDHSRQYNWNYSQEDALEMQERLFREAAARMREQNQKHQNFYSSSTTGKNNTNNSNNANGEQQQQQQQQQQHTSSKCSSSKSAGIPVITEPMWDIATRYPMHWMWWKENAHASLGLPHGAALNLVRTQYRKLAKRYHPDKSKNADTIPKFHGISRAYRKLIEHSAPPQHTVAAAATTATTATT